MSRVCVVGGGTAGLEAAREAERCGANVTLIERSGVPEPPWKDWPGLISSRSPSQAPHPALGRAFHGTVVRTEIRSAGPGCVTARDGAKTRFDSVVVATGCGFEPATILGHQKEGVHVLDRADEYAELGQRADSASRVVVFGEGARGLQVADRVSRGSQVRLVISHWAQGEPSWNVRAAIFKAAGERGVSIGYGVVSRALGVGPLEAIVVDGKIVSCDLLVLLPRRVPRVIPMAAQTGRRGGLSVDRYLMTSTIGTFAAGGCAEISCQHGVASTLEDETGMSGRVAGANAAGRHLAFEGGNTREFRFFGLRWAMAGGGVVPFLESPEVGLVSETLEESACTIAFERSTGRVLGVETVGAADSVQADLSSVSAGSASLRTVAYGGSSDISLVSETARLGLRIWRSS
jgi:apoptosis-inducing factor 3